MHNAHACWCLKRTNTSEGRLCALPSPSPPSLSARKRPSSSLWAISAGATTSITSLFVRSVLSFARSGGAEMWKTRLSRECSAGATTPFYLLSTSCWVMVCPIQLPPNTHISSNVSLELHGHKNCCTNMHLSIPCHCLWYIDIRCIVECHKMSLPKAVCQMFNPAVSAKSFSTLSPRFPYFEFIETLSQMSHKKNAVELNILLQECMNMYFNKTPHSRFKAFQLFCLTALPGIISCSHWLLHSTKGQTDKVGGLLVNIVEHLATNWP